MADGHYGLENKEAGRQKVNRFELVLGYLIQDAASAYFVVHVRTTGSYLSELTSAQFLELLDYSHFRGQCQFFGSDCYYRYIYDVPINRQERDPFDRRVQYAHQSFQQLAQELPGMYEQVHDIYRRLGSIPDLFPSLRQYGPQPLPGFSQEAPPWIDEAKVDEHRQTEQQLKQAAEREKYFSAVEYILWGTGEKLEEAVHFVLEDLALEVRRTPKGSTVDRIVLVPGSGMSFGFEITGLNDAIKKKSNKISQALAFLQQREAGEKAVILANTFNDEPLDKRAGEADFTADALELMQPLGIVGMTTVTLYEIWKAVKYGGVDMSIVAEQIYNHPGGEFQFDHALPSAP